MKRPRDVRLKHGGRWILSALCAAVFCVLSADAHAQDPVRLYVDGVLDDDSGAGIAGRSFLVLAADALRGSPSQWQPNAVEASDVSLALLYGGQFTMAGRDDSVRTPEGSGTDEAAGNVVSRGSRKADPRWLFPAGGRTRSFDRTSRDCERGRGLVSGSGGHHFPAA